MSAELARSISLVSTVITTVLILVMFLTYRRERKIGGLSLLVSALLSLSMLLVFAWVTGASLRPLVAVPLLVAGLLFGIFRSYDTRLYYRDQRLLGRRSAWFLVGWGASVLIVQLLSLVGERALLAVGLVPFYFTTGAQIGMNCSLYMRRRRVPPPPQSLPESLHEPALSHLPELP